MDCIIDHIRCQLARFPDHRVRMSPRWTTDLAVRSQLDLAQVRLVKFTKPLASKDIIVIINHCALFRPFVDYLNQHNVVRLLALLSVFFALAVFSHNRSGPAMVQRHSVTFDTKAFLLSIQAPTF
jgi:hypothetical protein